MRRVVLCLVATLVVGAPALPQTTDPYAIFAQARHKWIAQQYPRTISFTIAMQGIAGNDTLVRHYHVDYDARTGQPYPDAVSREQRAHPFVPRGINLNIAIAGIPVPLNPEHANQDPFGIPVLAPNYSFGVAPTVSQASRNTQALIAEIRSEFPSKSPAVIATGLPEIGEVTAVHHDYIMQLVGIESTNGTMAYHLRLQPIRQPKHYRLRDLWIDAHSYALEKLKSDGNFEHGAATRSLWDVDFQTVAGLEFIAAERAEGALRYADDPFGITGHVIDHQSLVFEDIQFSDRVFLQAPPVNPDLEILREPD